MNRALAAWFSAGIAAAACGGQRETPTNTAPTNTAKEGSPMSGAVSPAGDKHPGEIVYEDRVAQRKWTERAADVPLTIAWVKSGEIWKPVVRIEIKGSGEVREITTYGPNGEFLESTMTAPPPPPSEPTPTPTLSPTPTKP